MNEVFKTTLAVYSKVVLDDFYANVLGDPIN